MEGKMERTLSAVAIRTSMENVKNNEKGIDLWLEQYKPCPLNFKTLLGGNIAPG